MTIQQIILELENVVEQSTNDEEIGKESVVDALTDLIRDIKGNDMDFVFEDDNHYGSFEETDFGELDY